MRYRKIRVIVGKGVGDDRFSKALRGLAIDKADRVYAVGDSVLNVYSAEGKLLRYWHTERPGYAVAVAGDGRVFVGEAGHIEIFDGTGKLLDTWRDHERLGLVTTIGLTDKHVLVGDVKARCIRRYDSSGKFINNIGDDNRMRGFRLPNQHLDFAIDARGVIHVANSGKHRVERYTLEGKLLGHFGRFGGQDPAGFSGCCNPTNVALTREGRVVVTEKAGPRVKIYDADGKLLTLFGGKDFDPGCKNMDVAVDSDDRIYVVDTVRLEIFIYESEDAGPTTRPAAIGSNGMKR